MQKWSAFMYAQVHMMTAVSHRELCNNGREKPFPGQSMMPSWHRPEREKGMSSSSSLNLGQPPGNLRQSLK